MIDSRQLIMFHSMLNTLMKELKIATSYIYESIKAVDYLLKILGKVNDDRKENCSEK